MDDTSRALSSCAEEIELSALNHCRLQFAEKVFFQAEDRIRDIGVTGVQTCALPISLSPEETDKLYHAIRDILGRAVELRGTTFDSYHDAFGETGGFQNELKVFTHAGEPCPVCGQEIRKTRVAGRGTHVCPSCQPLEPVVSISIDRKSTRLNSSHANISYAVFCLK